MKLTDFGFSVLTTDPSKRLKVFCGTPSYMPPEITQRREYLGRPVDVWSLGVLLYAMVAGHFPFNAKTYPELYKKIASVVYKVPEHFSPALVNLLSRILNPDPSKRISLAHARLHPWMSPAVGPLAPPTGGPPSSHSLLISQDPASDINEAVLTRCTQLGFKRGNVAESVLSRGKTATTTTYYLLLTRMGRGFTMAQLKSGEESRKQQLELASGGQVEGGTRMGSAGVPGEEGEGAGGVLFSHGGSKHTPQGGKSSSNPHQQQTEYFVVGGAAASRPSTAPMGVNNRTASVLASQHARLAALTGMASSGSSGTGGAVLRGGMGDTSPVAVTGVVGQHGRTKQQQQRQGEEDERAQEQVLEKESSTGGAATHSTAVLQAVSFHRPRSAMNLGRAQAPPLAPVPTTAAAAAASSNSSSKPTSSGSSKVGGGTTAVNNVGGSGNSSLSGEDAVFGAPEGVPARKRTLSFNAPTTPIVATAAAAAASTNPGSGMGVRRNSVTTQSYRPAVGDLVTLGSSAPSGTLPTPVEAVASLPVQSLPPVPQTSFLDRIAATAQSTGSTAASRTSAGGGAISTPLSISPPPSQPSVGGGSSPRLPPEISVKGVGGGEGGGANSSSPEFRKVATSPFPKATSGPIRVTH